MAIQLTCIKQNGEKLDITKLVSGVTWSGDKNSCSRKLEFEIVSSANDINIPNIDIPLSSLAIFYENGKELFRGFIYDRHRRSSSNSTAYTCFDYAEKLNKIKVCCNVKNKSGDEVLKMLLSEYGYKASKNISKAKKKISDVFINESIYDVVSTCYLSDTTTSNRKYMIYAEKDTISVRLRGYWSTDIEFSEGNNINSSEFKESTQNMVTKVVIIDEKGNKKGEVVDSNNRKIHGLFQEMYKIEEGKNATLEAKAMLKGVENSCSLEGYGDTTCITGFCVKVKDSHTGLVGKFYIDSDTHTWQGNNHKVSLGLNFENII